ncbi:MAG: pilin, partial [Patescibacteria group bacterium]
MASGFTRAIFKRSGIVALVLGFQLALLIPGAIVQAQVAGSKQGSCFTEPGCTQPTVKGDFELNEKECGLKKGFCYAKPKPVQLIISLGAKGSVVDLGDYISSVYRYAVSVAGVIAAVMMMVGGFQYLTAGGDASRVTQGKERIVDSLVGLFLALAAYLILNTINPDLVNLRLPRIPIIKRQEFVACVQTESCYPCGVKYGVLQLPEGQSYIGDCTKETSTDPAKMSSAVAECTGKGCKKDCGSDVGAKCRQIGGKIDDKLECAGKAPTAVVPAEGQAKPEYVCKGCSLNGTTCSPTGANDTCCGGFCGKDSCTDGQIGAACNDKSDCASGICNTNWGNNCSAGEVGSPCSQNSECKSGFKCSTNWGNVCTPGTKFSLCD